MKKLILLILVAFSLLSCETEQVYPYQNPEFIEVDAGYDINDGMLFVLMGFTCEAEEEFEIRGLATEVEVTHNGEVYKELFYSTNLRYQPNCGNRRRLQLGHNGPGEYSLHYAVEILDNEFVKPQIVEIDIDFELW